MTFLTPPTWLENSEDHNAVDYRTMLGALVPTSMVADTAALAVTERSGTANMSIDVAAGSVFVASTRSVDEGVYHAYNDATINVPLSSADATNARIDRVLVQIRDQAQDAGLTQNDARILVVEGTPAASPTAPAISVADYVELAQVTVPASATSITDSDITDLRVVRRPVELVKFTASGSFTKANYPGLRSVRARVVGGGGGSGGANVANESGGGGGGGGYAETVIDAADLAASETVTIGAGGTAGSSSGGNGGSGGATSFGSHAAASGGGGGDGTGGNRQGGDPGAGTAGTVQISGQAGTGGSTGGSGGPGGTGGSSLLGGGGVGSGFSGGGAAGTAGGNYGGGAGGARGTSNAGAAGAGGVVLLDLYY